jgi:hypothetical protein
MCRPSRLEGRSRFCRTQLLYGAVEQGRGALERPIEGSPYRI